MDPREAVEDTEDADEEITVFFSTVGLVPSMTMQETVEDTVEATSDRETGLEGLLRRELEMTSRLMSIWEDTE